MANPKVTVEDGSVISLSQLADIKSPSGTSLSLSQVGSTNTYTQTVSNFDGSGRSELWRIDFGDRQGTLSRKVV